MTKTKDITLKITSVLFAVILWFNVMNTENPIRNKEIKNVIVEKTNLESLEVSNLILMDSEEFSISVKLSGRINDISNLSPKNIKAKIDLLGSKKGTNKIPVDVSLITPIEGVSIVDFSPKEIAVNLDKIVEKQVPVKLKVLGKTKTGYIKGKEELKQRSILIQGPKKTIDLIKEAQATLFINNESSDIVTSLPLVLIDVDGKEVINDINKKPSIVDVKLPILKVKRVKVEPVIKGEPLNGYVNTESIIDPVYVNIKGDDNKIDEITSLKTKPIDITGIKSDLSVEVEMILPEGIELAEDKNTVKVNVEIDKIVTKNLEFNLDQIRVENLNTDYKLGEIKNEGTILITLRGPEEEINKINEKDIKPYINLEGLGVGEHSIDIMLHSPIGIDILKINPTKVVLTIIDKNADTDNEEAGDDE